VSTGLPVDLHIRNLPYSTATCNLTVMHNESAFCYALRMITVDIETFARCQLYRLLWP